MYTHNFLKAKNKKYVIFDLDGTICDIIIDWTTWKIGMLRLFSKYDANAQQTLNDLSQDQNKYVKKYGMSLLIDLRQYIMEYERDFTSSFEPIEKTIELINNIYSCELFVWSANSEKTVFKALSALGLASRFKRIVGRESVIMQKPDPEGYFLLKKKYNFENETSVVFIGNAPNDALAAKEAGIDYINVNEIIV